MSMQNTLISVGGVLAPTAFGVLVELTSWNAAYALLALAPLAAFVVLAPLEGDEDDRARRRAETSEPIPVEAA
jgi:MFS family permease